MLARALEEGLGLDDPMPVHPEDPDKLVGIGCARSGGGGTVEADDNGVSDRPDVMDLGRERRGEAADQRNRGVLNEAFDARIGSRDGAGAVNGPADIRSEEFGEDIAALAPSGPLPMPRRAAARGQNGEGGSSGCESSSDGSFRLVGSLRKAATAGACFVHSGSPTPEISKYSRGVRGSDRRTASAKTPIASSTSLSQPPALVRCATCTTGSASRFNERAYSGEIF
jgi:hypothetical protein